MILLEEYEELRSEYIGVCITCTHRQAEVEPDACDVPCEKCGHPTVFGAEELVFMGLVT